ncbi:MAG TPA: hydroxymethylbilane synthase [Thermoanaerobaculia bacterium]|nr:hydroxymethylbilane synthase [Thermoanaerobaculia bacterium]
MTPAPLRLGTRRSPLAIAQSRTVARALEAAHPGLAVELVPLLTSGDLLPGDLSARGGKGLFTRELEAGLLDGGLDLAVHSLKDLPAVLPDGLAVAAYPERADPRDVLVSEVADALDALPEGAAVLTGALRRRAQLLARRPDLVVRPLRGNVDTRLRRWRESGAAAVVLAAAGLERLGLTGFPVHPIPPELMLPAPGQGTLAVEVRRGSRAEALCRALDHPPTARAATAERAVVVAFGGDCTLPLAAWAREELGGDLRLDAVLASPDGRRSVRGEGTGPAPDEAAAACIAALRAAGAQELLAELRRLPPTQPPSAKRKATVSGT